jgi:uncharacterized integral membrane protein (TIGR00697 family)
MKYDDKVLNKQALILFWLISVHTSLLIASNAGGAKMIALPGGLSASATVFSYSITFPICDLINEFFGNRAARLTVNIGLAGLVISVLFFQFAIQAPGASFWNGQEAYASTLGMGWRILLGGWLSYTIGNHLDVWVFQRIKDLTGEKYFWLRKNGSTAISQLVDTCIFMGVAFGGVYPIATAIPGQYLLKLAIAVLCTPFSYLIIRLVRSSLPKESH